MTTTTYGNKYEATKDLNRVALAKLIRADIKAAVKSGTIPTAKYSVTCSGSSIDISVSNVVKEGFVLANPIRLEFEIDHPHDSLYQAPVGALSRHSVEAEAILDVLNKIHASYNYDGSDLQSDYFHVRYYGHASFAWQWADGVKEAERAAFLASRAELVAIVTNATKAEPVAAQVAWLEAMGAL